MVKVSVIVPAYNASRYIEKCLDSLVSQTLKDIEIIVVNDASKDNTLDIIKAYQKEYDNIVLINHETNKGIGRTRNDAIEQAKGEYIGFVDSDDYVAEDMFEKYYEFARNNKLDMVYAGHYEDHDGQLKKIDVPDFDFSVLDINPELLVSFEYGPWSKIYRTEIIKKNNIRFPETLKYEDMPFVCIAMDYCRIGKLDGNYYYYVVHSNSESTTIDKRCFDIIDILNLVNDHYTGRYHDQIEYLNILHMTRYLLRQKYQKDRKVKNEFIDRGYEHLDFNFPGWRKNSYYHQQSFLKRLLKSNKSLMKLYCNI